MKFRQNQVNLEGDQVNLLILNFLLREILLTLQKP